MGTSKSTRAATTRVSKRCRIPVAVEMVLPVSAWPAIDRQLWESGTAPPGGLRRSRGRYAASLTPCSVRLAAKGYGRFLAIQAANGQLNPDLGPSARVTLESVADFFDALQGAGNVDNTVKGRLFHLRMALRVMVPDADFDWITRPGGVSLDALLLQEPDDEPPPASSAALFKWGMALMADAALPTQEFQKIAFCRAYRDGLIIALFACRAPRLGSLAAMRMGKNLYKLNGDYWVRLQSMIVKNKRELEYSLPPELTSCIDRYLSDIRPVLLDPAVDDAVWGNGDGGAYTYRSIETKINRLTKQKFGRAYGPHMFRDAFASSMAEFDHGNPGLAAVILGITERVVNAHYRKARQIDAGRKLQSNLHQERKNTRAMAQRAFNMRF